MIRNFDSQLTYFMQIEQRVQIHKIISISNTRNFQTTPSTRVYELNLFVFVYVHQKNFPVLCACHIKSWKLWIQKSAMFLHQKQIPQTAEIKVFTILHCVKWVWDKFVKGHLAGTAYHISISLYLSWV